MTREQYLKLTSILTAGSLLPQNLFAEIFSEEELKRSDFGKDFVWGTATAAYQIEGGWNEDGKGESNWDHFTHFKKRKIKTRETGDVADDFYHRYESDIELMRKMNIPAFRFSLSWSRIIPNGVGEVNQKGIDLLEKRIEEKIHAMNHVSESATLTRLRHKQAFEKSLDSLRRAKQALQEEASTEFILEDLKAAVESLRELIGEVYSEDLLDVIFQEFCIGK